MFSIKTRMALTFGSALLALVSAAPLPAQPAAATATASVAVGTPPPPCVPVVVTATPSPIPYTGPYVELHDEVERALASVVIEPLPPVRNATNTGWIFRWNLSWTPPNLEGLKGAHILYPNGKQYLFASQIVILPDPLPANEIVYPQLYQSIDGTQVEVSDLQLPKGVYKWQVSAFYNSMVYKSISAWTPWQRLEVK